VAVHRQAEREIAAAGLDVKVARANFFPVVTITGGLGYEAFNMRYLFLTPEAFIGNIAAGAVGPLINFKAIKAQYLSANARQLQAVYNYQRVVIDAFTQVVTRMAKVENYTGSIEIKKQQVQSLESAVGVATNLYQLQRIEFATDYLDVLTAQNELFDAIRDLIDTKREQLAAIVNTYQALGGGLLRFVGPPQVTQGRANAPDDQPEVRPRLAVEEPTGDEKAKRDIPKEKAKGDMPNIDACSPSWATTTGVTTCLQIAT